MNDFRWLFGITALLNWRDYKIRKFSHYETFSAGFNFFSIRHMWPAGLKKMIKKPNNACCGSCNFVLKMKRTMNRKIRRVVVNTFFCFLFRWYIKFVMSAFYCIELAIQIYDLTFSKINTCSEIRQENCTPKLVYKTFPSQSLPLIVLDIEVFLSATWWRDLFFMK